MQKASSSEYLELGYIARAHGIRGALRIRLHNEFSNSLEHVSYVYIKPKDTVDLKRYNIEDINLLGDGFAILFLEGLESRTESEKFKGSSLFIEKKLLPALDDGEFYHFQLIDSTVRTEDGQVVGIVSSIETKLANDILVIENEYSQTCMVPIVASYIVSIDVMNKSIVVKNDGVLKTDYTNEN